MFFYNKETPKWPNAGNKWKRGCQLAANKDKQIIFKIRRTLSIAFLAFSLATYNGPQNRIIGLKVDSLTTESVLESLRKLKFYPLSMLSMMIKISYRSCERLDSSCKIFNPTMPYKQALCTLMIVNFSNSNHIVQFEKVAILPPHKGLEFSGTKNVKKCAKIIRNFPEGWRYGYFLELHITISIINQ